MLRYDSTPAETQTTNESWPTDSILKRDALRPTLVMFVHPKCPCSRASVGELTELAARAGDKFAIDVVFWKPAGFGEGWEKTDLWRSAEAIPGATVYCDVDGVETNRFRTEASGETLVYLANGTLAFHGGLTASRGHRGESAGRNALEQLFAGETLSCDHTPVYGCSLVDRTCRLPAADSQTIPQDK
jgi:hypothetical protein